jgi:hypothetical protein
MKSVLMVVRLDVESREIKRGKTGGRALTLVPPSQWPLRAYTQRAGDLPDPPRAPEFQSAQLASPHVLHLRHLHQAPRGGATLRQGIVRPLCLRTTLGLRSADPWENRSSGIFKRG